MYLVTIWNKLISWLILYILFVMDKTCSSFNYGCFKIENVTAQATDSTVVLEWSLTEKSNCSEANSIRPLKSDPLINNLPESLDMTQFCQESKCRFNTENVQLCTLYSISLGKKKTDFIIFENETAIRSNVFSPIFTNITILVKRSALKTECLENLTAVWFTLNINDDSIVERILRNQFRFDENYFILPYPEKCPKMVFNKGQANYEIQLKFEYLSKYNGSNWIYKTNMDIGTPVEEKDITYDVGSTWIYLQWPAVETSFQVKYYEMILNNRTCVLDGNHVHVSNGFRYSNFSSVCNTGDIELLSCTRYNIAIRIVYINCNYSQIIGKQIVTKFNDTNDYVKNLKIETKEHFLELVWSDPDCSEIPVIQWIVRVTQRNDRVRPEITEELIFTANKDMQNKIIFKENSAVYGNESRIMNNITISSCNTYQIEMTPNFSGGVEGSPQSLTVTTNLTHSDILNVTSVNVRDASFDLQWNIPKRCLSQSVQSRIKINGSAVNLKIVCDQRNEMPTCTAKVNQSTSKIAPCKFYHVTVGDKQTTVYTKQGKDIEIKGFNYISGPNWVNIMWKKPECIQQLSHYEIQFQEGKYCKFFQSNLTSYNQNHYQLNITNGRYCSEIKLFPCTLYNLTIRSIYNNASRNAPFKKHIFTAPNEADSRVKDVITESQNRGFTIQWKFPACTNITIQSWHILLHDKEKSSKKSFFCNVQTSSSYGITVKNNTFQCQGEKAVNTSMEISPCRSYQVNISPKFILFGLVSSVETHTTTKFNESDISNQTIHDITESGFTLQWMIPDECRVYNDTNATIDIGGVSIRLRPNCTAGNKRAICQTRIDSSVHPIAHCDDYQVEVGNAVMNISTLPGKLGAVQDLTAISTNSTNILLRWKKSDCERKRAVEKYSLTIENMTSTFSQCVQKCDNDYFCLNMAERSCNETEFMPRPCTNYTIIFSPIYDRLNESYNQMINVTTKPDSSQGSLQSVEVNNISHSAVEIQWKNPTCPVEIGFLQFEINGQNYSSPSNRRRELPNIVVNALSMNTNVQLNGELIGNLTHPLQPCQNYTAKLGTQYDNNGEIFWTNVTFNTMSDIRLENVTSAKESRDSKMLAWEYRTKAPFCNHTFEIQVKDKNGAVKKKLNVTSSPFELGQLEYETNYTVSIRVFDAFGYTPFRQDYNVYFLPESFSVADKILIGAIVILVILIVAVGLILRSKRLESIIRRKWEKQANVPLQPLDHTELKRHRIIITELNDTSEFSLEHEYEELKKAANQLKLAQTVAISQQLKPKNRYINTLPYDFNRVILFSIPGQEYSDYINASYVPGFKGNKEFIAAQGPMSTTVTDFWRMIWEQHVRVIVMVTSLFEDGKAKCEKYWPDERSSTSFDEIIVSHDNEQNFGTFVVRELQASKGGVQRLVKQFHFTDWPDFGCPKDPESLIAFVEAVREEMETFPQSPTIVHCSAGVGRTGTFIAMDWLMHEAQNQDEIDVYDMVFNLRRYRVNMVQTEEQYMFLHNCLVHYVKTRVKKQK